MASVARSGIFVVFRLKFKVTKWGQVIPKQLVLSRDRDAGKQLLTNRANQGNATFTSQFREFAWCFSALQK